MITFIEAYVYNNSGAWEVGDCGGFTMILQRHLQIYIIFLDVL